MIKKLVFILIVVLTFYEMKGENIDISGNWSMSLDKANAGEARGFENMEFSDFISLPGTTDMAGYGDPDTLKLTLTKPQLLHLTRKHSYIGQAWYSREIQIPAEYIGKHFILSFERTIWSSDVWIDGEKVNGTGTSLIAPHTFDVTSKIKVGQKQRLTIRIDNRQKFDISVQGLAHSYTDHTQTIWNGIIGKMEIQVVDPVTVENVKVIPDINKKRVKVQVDLKDFENNEKGKYELLVSIINKKTAKIITTLSKKVSTKDKSIEVDCNVGNDIKLWSEFTPEVYTAKVILKSKKFKSCKNVDFGMREISRRGASMLINGNPLFLRGTLECCIFPLTGCPPMTTKEWVRIFSIAKEWGLNHLRFHSWCPPKVAFEVADEMGLYLQVELPLWTLTLGQDKQTISFLYDEANRIIKEYGNHPSFCLFSMGNEIQKDMTVTEALVNYLKAKDNRHLYTNTSFTFEKGYGASPMSNDDFLVTQWTKNGWVRGQGVFNGESPTFNKDYSVAVKGLNVPLITHEIGQYAVYPNMKEISKYSGVLDPVNFKAIKKDLENKGLLHKAADFTQASGKLAAILYKEEIERALKTAGISGFQLLDLHDFPGQGTALVGLLDAFWDSKGIIDASVFREFCAPIVPLAKFPKATYKNDETFEAQIDISNYSDTKLDQKAVEWIITDSKNNKISSGTVNANIALGYNTNIAKISAKLNKIDVAQKLTLQVFIKGTEYKNHWNIWVYPTELEIKEDNIFVTDNLEKAMAQLKKGAKVLLNPNWKVINGIEGKFVPVFWSPVHFPKQAGTMGILCNPSHAALKHFPSDMNTDWQWWDLLTNSTPINIDTFNGGSSIVDVIDNFANNRKFSLIYECKVGNGKLLISTCDVLTNLNDRIVAKQLKYSLLKYMQSDDFNPSTLLNESELKHIINNKTTSKKDSADGIY